jgi:membrane protein YqaA with SNARE-associated domain
MGLMVGVFIWGFAEATFFFIIPDVLLSAIALYSGKKAIIACLYALLGALIGGTMIYTWGAIDTKSSIAFVESIPAINHQMVMEVKHDLKEEGLIAMILGPTRGIPYKIYAISTNGLGISYLAFLVASIPARFIRFLFVTFLFWVIGKYLCKNFSIRGKYGVWAATWFIIYVIYFSGNPS